MAGRREEAAACLTRAAERYRESFADAPPGSWGRPIGSMKARLLADDWEHYAIEKGVYPVKLPVWDMFNWVAGDAERAALRASGRLPCLHCGLWHW